MYIYIYIYIFLFTYIASYETYNISATTRRPRRPPSRARCRGRVPGSGQAPRREVESSPKNPARMIFYVSPAMHHTQRICTARSARLKAHMRGPLTNHQLPLCRRELDTQSCHSGVTALSPAKAKESDAFLGMCDAVTKKGNRGGHSCGSARREKASGRGPDESSRDTNCWGKSWHLLAVSVLLQILQNPVPDEFCKIHPAIAYNVALNSRELLPWESGARSVHQEQRRCKTMS